MTAGNRAPIGSLRLNRASPQARGIHWWVPLYQGHGYDLAGRRMPNEKNERAYTPRSEINARGAENTSANDNQNRIGNYDLGTVAAPFSMVCLCVADSTVDWAGCFASRDSAENTTGGDTLVLGQDDAGNLMFADYNNVSWADDGPALRTGELILIGVTVRGATDFTLWQLSKSGGVERVDVTSRTIGTTGSPIFHIGEDDVSVARVWDGPIFDCRLAKRAWEDADYRHMFAAQTQFDLVLQTRRNFFVPEAAVGGATATSAQTLPSLNQAAVGVMQPSATSAQALAAIIQSASGEQSFTATSAQVLSAITQAAVGLMHPDVTAALALPAVVQSGSGTHTVTVTGTGVQALAPVTQSATGVMQPSATGAQALAAIVQSGIAVEVFGGAGAQDLAPITQAASGVTGESTGTAAQVLAAITQSAAVGEIFTGTAAQVLAALTMAGVGAAPFSATSAQDLAAVVQSASGVQVFTGTAAQVLAAITQAAAMSQAALAVAAVRTIAVPARCPLVVSSRGNVIDVEQ